MKKEINPSTSLRINSEHGRTIKNLSKVVNRLSEAIKNKERIVLYGDADPDGVCSVIILQESLEAFNLKPVQIYFPDREEEGYGINKKALKILSRHTPALFIALDCGIGNAEEVDLANKMGFEVMIIDHHKVLPKIPKASIICDPKQEGDNFPFKELSTGGIVYKISKVLFSSFGKEYEPERFLELAAIATLADLMPLKDENKKLVEEGISALNYTKRAGLEALIKTTQFENLDLREVRQKIIAPLNASGPEDNLTEAYLILIEKDPERAKERAENLIKKAKFRKQEINRIYYEVKKRVSPSQEIIFQGDEEWGLVFLGTVASLVCHEYKKPIFLFKKGKKESPGAVRTPKGIDGVKAMISCAYLLNTYGGHPLASGFRIENKNLEKFKVCLLEYFKKLKI
jgi:single-stranded-DNA-specific exonuclease